VRQSAEVSDANLRAAVDRWLSPDLFPHQRVSRARRELDTFSQPGRAPRQRPAGLGSRPVEAVKLFSSSQRSAGAAAWPPGAHCFDACQRVPIFTAGDLSSVLQARQQEARRAVEGWEPEKLLAIAEADVVEYLVAEYSVACPVLHRDRAEQLPVSRFQRMLRRC
jgi:hypothetical protein